jgi:pimeloyl-ACP methyl ester carboxylesterase
MRRKTALLALSGILLLVLGALLTFYASRRYAVHRYVVDAGSCRMNVDVVQRADVLASADAGAVVLFHGISANKLIMLYLARSFAELGLRVYVPDLPGHGRSPGPFTPVQAEACAASFVRGLAARGMIVPGQTILAGHSMGGAMALRIAEKIRPAGVIAISPAPMQEGHGVGGENLLFHGVPRIVPNTLIMAARIEPKGLRASAEDLVKGSTDPTVRYSLVPWTSHAGVLFSPTAARESQAWAARVLSTPDTGRLPSRADVLGCVLGILAILLLSGPFIREATGKEPQDEQKAAEQPSRLRGALEVAAVSMLVVPLLHFWLPLRLLHLYEGDYVASFFLLVGLALVLLNARLAATQFRTKPAFLAGAALAGLLLHLLISGWSELTATSSWLTLARWLRFPVFFLATFVFLYAVELLAGPARNGVARYGFVVLLVALAWLAPVYGAFHLKTGEILVVLLGGYFALFFLLMNLGAQLVRRMTGSPAAAAVFGAILLAGFCLVVFPLS